MLYEAQLTYSVPLLRSAVFAYWKRSVGVGLPIVLILMTVYWVFLLARGDSSWIVGALAAILFVAVAFIIAIYIVHYRNAFKKLRAMGPPRATFAAHTDHFSFASQIGTSTLRWSSVRELWCFPTFWLLLFSKAQFATLPLADISAEMQTFVVERVRENGGTIVGEP